jgi:hypothetical protein
MSKTNAPIALLSARQSWGAVVNPAPKIDINRTCVADIMFFCAGQGRTGFRPETKRLSDWIVKESDVGLAMHIFENGGPQWQAFALKKMAAGIKQYMHGRRAIAEQVEFLTKVMRFIHSDPLRKHENPKVADLAKQIRISIIMESSRKLQAMASGQTL